MIGYWQFGITLSVPPHCRALCIVAEFERYPTPKVSEQFSTPALALTLNPKTHPYIPPKNPNSFNSGMCLYVRRTAKTLIVMSS